MSSSCRKCKKDVTTGLSLYRKCHDVVDDIVTHQIGGFIASFLLLIVFIFAAAYLVLELAGQTAIFSDLSLVLGSFMLLFTLLMTVLFVSVIGIANPGHGVTRLTTKKHHYMVHVYTATGMLIGAAIGFILGDTIYQALLMVPVFGFLGLGLSYTIAYPGKHYKWL